MSRAKRKLAAILYAEVVGFSRLMEDDESATVRQLKHCREVFREAIGRHAGRMVDAPGDALLVDFASAIDAVHCAVEVQEALVERNQSVAESRRMNFRIGINTGDVLEEDGALFGDSVNLAARIQALAEPGGICVSAKVFDEVNGRAPATFEFGGEKKVKNIAKPVRTYRWLRQERLALRFLGEPQVLRGRNAVPLPQSKKTRVLLAYLAVTGRAHRRERLCELLWDVPDDPRAALRWSLSKLRRIVDEPQQPRIVADRETVAFEPHGAEVDVLAVRARLAGGADALATEDLEDLAGELAGTFLEGVELSDLFELAVWCGAEREEMRIARLQVLRALLTRLAHDPRRALPYARALVEMDPEDDTARKGLQGLQRALRQAPAVPDRAEAAATATEITSAAAPAGAAEAVPSASPELSIAVLPFENLTGDQEQDLFADGIAEDLITALSKISEVLVIARNSTAQYKGRAVDPVHVASELGVRYVVQGSFRRAGRRLRVAAQLVDARGGRTIWADRYDRDLEDIFGVQDDITRQIVTALEVKLTQGEQARLWHRHAHSMEAYEDYLRGLDSYNRFTKSSNRQARHHFESAIARSPEFAAAYHYLGWAHMTDGWFDWSPDRDASLSQALACADKAIAVDETHADGYAVRAFIHTLRGDHDRAAVEAEHAVALSPGGATVCHMLALVRLFGGDPQEAASLERQALRLSPLAQDNYLVVLGHACCLLGRFAEAVEALKRACQAKPYWLTVRTLLALAYSELGRIDEARAEVAEVLRINPRFSVTGWGRFQPYKSADDLRRHLDALRNAGLPDTESPPTANERAADVPATRYARSGEVNIAYQVTGRGAADLVFVPGWVSHVEHAWEEPTFAAFLQRLCRFSRLMLLDRRGTGLSDPVDQLPTLEERMDDLRAVMDAAGSKRAFLLGISESGPMCTLFAATYPERTAGLILCNTFARNVRSKDLPWATPMGGWKYLQELVDSQWGSGVSARVFCPKRAVDPDFVQRWGRFERRAVSRGAMRKILGMAMNTDVRHVLSSVSAPTLVVHRAGDQAVRVEGGRYLAEHIRGALLVEVPGEDHFPWVGDTGAILDAVEHFVTGVRPLGEVDRVLTTVLCAEVIDPSGRRGDDSWRDLLVERKDAMRRQLEGFRGHEIDSRDQCLLASFDGPVRAIRCAAAMRATAQVSALAVRAGLHTGECAVLGNHLSGLALELAAGVCRLANPGEVMVSSTVTDLVAGSGLAFASRGTHALKGIPGEWRLYAVEA